MLSRATTCAPQGAALLMPNTLPALETKHDGSRRVCRKSDPPVYKPDRAHFCRQLNRCVLKMDHFCPWTNSCIGFGNHKFFMLFIFYMVCSLVLIVLLLSPDFSRYIEGREFGRQPSPEEFRVSFMFLALCLLGTRAQVVMAAVGAGAGRRWRG